MGSLSTVVCDDPSAPEATGTAIRDLFAASGPLYIASPYVSGSPERLLGLPRSRWGDVTLLCDLDSGDCDPFVLRRLLEQHASVFTLKGLHSKVYISSGGAAVGSANFTPNGLGAGKLEAIALVREATAIRHLLKWFEGLRQVATDVLPRLCDSAEFAKLLARWRARQSSNKGCGLAPVASAKPSLLAAILRGDSSLKDVSFSWYTNEAELKKSAVKHSALRHGIPLPTKGSQWTWFESPFKPGLVARLNRKCRGKPQISWKVKYDGNEDIKRFMAHDYFAAPFLGGFRMGGIVVSVIGNFPTPTPFDLGADRRQLAQILTRGFARAGSRLRRAINNELSILSVSHLAQLAALGLPP